MTPQQLSKLSDNDHGLYNKAINGNFPAFFPRDWADLRDKADSPVLVKYFESKVIESSQPFATWPKSK